MSVFGDVDSTGMLAGGIGVQAVAGRHQGTISTYINATVDTIPQPKLIRTRDIKPLRRGREGSRGEQAGRPPRRSYLRGLVRSSWWTSTDRRLAAATIDMPDRGRHKNSVSACRCCCY